MRQTLPPLNWLRTFEASARHLSFTGAARELNMTQSAVSQQIKALEGHLGKPLFFRRPKALELTEAGVTFIPVVRDAFRMLSRGTRAITGGEENAVTVQSNLTFAIHWLAPRIARFRARHPEVSLNLMTEIWEPQAGSQAADIEIRFSLRPADDVRAKFLFRDHYYPVCAPQDPVTLETLAAQPLYDCTNMLCTWATWAEDQALIWPNPPVTYATTYSVTLSVAMAGGGLSMAHDAIAQGLIGRGLLRAPFEHRVEMPEAYYLILTPQAEDAPGARAFADWLQEEVAAPSSGLLGTQA